MPGTERGISRRWRSWRDARRQRIAIERYLADGVRIGSPGYGEYRSVEIPRVSTDPETLDTFARGQEMPAGYGRGLDERVVEYPWVLSRLYEGASLLLDAGSTLNFEWVASAPILQAKNVLVYTLAPEGTLGRPNYSYVYGDLRSTILRSGIVDTIVCISTLEHIGMDNSRFYTGADSPSERDRSGFRDVLREFHRLLKPAGQLLLTVPYGRYQDLGWLQQFDADLLSDAISAFGGTMVEIAYFRYDGDGWRRSSQADCASSEYVMIEDRSSTPPLHLASYAEGVACVELRKPV